MRRAAILILLILVVASGPLEFLRADQAAQPAPRSPSVPDPALIARWPAKPSADKNAFEGSQFIALSPAPQVGTGPFSVSVWVNAGDLAGGNTTYGRGIARSTRGEKVGDWLLSVHPDGRVRFCNWRRTGADADGSHVSRRPLVLPDAWCLIVATWDGKKNHLFVDGVEAPFDNGTTASGWETGHEVGRCWTGSDYYWDGLIDDLRVYRRALSTAEIQKAFQLKPPPILPPVVQPAGDPKVSQALDRVIVAQLRKNNLRPAPAADDAEFHRRIFLDLAGRIPTPAETEAFLADKALAKRHRLIDTLLAGREMPIAWAQVISGWLMPKEGRRDPLFVGYLRNGLTRKKPWDRFVREMLLARPTGPDDQYATYFLSYRKAALNDHTIARAVGRAFFGVNLRCAQCHDHPHVKQWTRARFFGLSAFFARTYEHTFTNAQNQKVISFGEKAAGELEYAVAGGKKKAAQAAPLIFLDGSIVVEPPAAKNATEPALPKTGPPPVPPFSRREALVRVALDPRSPYLKRAFVNRVWQRLMGRPLVAPVDMMYEGNPATHPQLLDLLADDFAGHGFDLRRLIAAIVQSEAYARTSRWPEKGTPPRATLYAVAIMKPLDADQIAMSLPLATGYFDGQLGSKRKRSMTQVRPIAPWKELIAEFDSDSEEFEPTAGQALFLLNSSYVQTHFQVGSKLAQALTAIKDDAALARRAYLAVVSRLPLPEESALVSRYLRERGPRSRPEACRELVWALVSSAEFRFNH